MNTTRPQLYLDFDDCLFDSHRLNGEFRAEIALRSGASHEAVAEAYQRSREGGSSPEKLLAELGLADDLKAELLAFHQDLMKRGESFLFSDSASACESLSKIADLHLLSFGQSRTQFAKWNSVPVLHPYFSSVMVVGVEGKGQIFSKFTPEQQSTPTFFVDDKISYLEDVNTLAPFVRTYQIIRFPERQVAAHPRIVHSLAELLHAVEWSPNLHEG